MSIGGGYGTSSSSSSSGQRSGFDVIEPTIVEILSSLLSVPYAQSVLGSQLQAQDRLTRLTNSRVGGGQGFVGSRVPDTLGGPRPPVSSASIRGGAAPQRNFSTGTAQGAPVMQNADFGPGALPFGNLEDILGLSQGSLNINDIIFDSSSTTGQGGGGGSGGTGTTNQFGQRAGGQYTGRDRVVQSEFDEEIGRLLDEKRSYFNFLTDRLSATMDPARAQAVAREISDDLFEPAERLAAQGAAGANTTDEVWRAEEDIYNFALAGFDYNNGEASAPGYTAIGTINGFIVNPLGGREAAGPPTSDRAGGGIRNEPGPGEVAGGRAFGDNLTNGSIFSESDAVRGFRAPSSTGIGGTQPVGNSFTGGGGGGPFSISEGNLAQSVLRGNDAAGQLGNLDPGALQDSLNRTIGGEGGANGVGFTGPILSDPEILALLNGTFGSAFGLGSSQVAKFNPNFEASRPITPSNPLLLVPDEGFQPVDHKGRVIPHRGWATGGTPVDFEYPLLQQAGHNGGVLLRNEQWPQQYDVLPLTSGASRGGTFRNPNGGRNLTQAAEYASNYVGPHLGDTSAYLEVLKQYAPWGSAGEGALDAGLLDLVGPNPTYYDIQVAAQRELDRIMQQNRFNQGASAVPGGGVQVNPQPAMASAPQSGVIGRSFTGGPVGPGPAPGVEPLPGSLGLPSPLALPGTVSLAEGGIVNEPTVATLGENGPEMVVPLGVGASQPAPERQSASIQRPMGGAIPYNGFGATSPLGQLIRGSGSDPTMQTDFNNLLSGFADPNATTQLFSSPSMTMNPGTGTGMTGITDPNATTQLPSNLSMQYNPGTGTGMTGIQDPNATDQWPSSPSMTLNPGTGTGMTGITDPNATTQLPSSPSTSSLGLTANAGSANQPAVTPQSQSITRPMPLGPGGTLGATNATEFNERFHNLTQTQKVGERFDNAADFNRWFNSTQPETPPPASEGVANVNNLTPGTGLLNSRSFEEETAFYRNLFANGFLGLEQIPQIMADLGMPIDVNGQLTPQQEFFIQQALSSSLESGFSNIDREAQLGQERLREELSPQLGLRSGDTPILDRGNRLEREALFAKGQLQNQLMSDAFNQRLNLPIQTATTNAGLNLQRLANQFQSATGLSDAFINQLMEEFNQQALLTGQSIQLAGAGTNFLSNLTNSENRQTGGTSSGESESESDSFNVNANIGLGGG